MRRMEVALAILSEGKPIGLTETLDVPSTSGTSQRILCQLVLFCMCATLQSMQIGVGMSHRS